MTPRWLSQKLRRKIGTSPKDEYQRLERISNEARVNSKQTRLALEQHLAVHHCYLHKLAFLRFIYKAPVTSDHSIPNITYGASD